MYTHLPATWLNKTEVTTSGAADTFQPQGATLAQSASRTDGEKTKPQGGILALGSSVKPRETRESSRDLPRDLSRESPTLAAARRGGRQRRSKTRLAWGSPAVVVGGCAVPGCPVLPGDLTTQVDVTGPLTLSACGTELYLCFKNYLKPSVFDQRRTLLNK